MGPSLGTGRVGTICWKKCACGYLIARGRDCGIDVYLFNKIHAVLSNVGLLLRSSCSNRIEEAVSKLTEIFPKSSLHLVGTCD